MKMERMAAGEVRQEVLYHCAERRGTKANRGVWRAAFKNRK